MAGRSLLQKIREEAETGGAPVVSRKRSSLKRLSGPDNTPAPTLNPQSDKLLDALFSVKASVDEMEAFLKAHESDFEFYARRMVQKSVISGRGDVLERISPLCAEKDMDTSEWLVGKSWEPWSSLVSAVASSDAKTVAWVIDKLPSSVIIDGQLAISPQNCSSPEIAGILLAAGVPEGSEKEKTLRLLSAVENRNAGLVKFWLERGASPYMEIRDFIIELTGMTVRISVFEYMIRERFWQKLLDVFASASPPVPSKVEDRMFDIPPSVKSKIQYAFLSAKNGGTSGGMQNSSL